MPPLNAVSTLAEAARWRAERVVEVAQANVAMHNQLDALRLEFEAVKHQLEWFRRPLFGQKSERRLLEPNPAQLYLGEMPVPEAAPVVPGKEIAAHTRRPRKHRLRAG